jgi:hypothetical protein
MRSNETASFFRDSASTEPSGNVLEISACCLRSISNPSEESKGNEGGTSSDNSEKVSVGDDAKKCPGKAPGVGCLGGDSEPDTGRREGLFFRNPSKNPVFRVPGSVGPELRVQRCFGKSFLSKIRGGRGPDEFRGSWSRENPVLLRPATKKSAARTIRVRFFYLRRMLPKHGRSMNLISENISEYQGTFSHFLSHFAYFQLLIIRKSLTIK